MEHTPNYISPDIKLSVWGDEVSRAETILEYHLLVWCITGEAKILIGGTTHVFHAGDTILIPRNTVASFVIYPKDGQPHKSVSIHLTLDHLRSFYAKIEFRKTGAVPKDIYQFNDHPLLQSFFASLIPLYNLKSGLPEDIAMLKITEALTILRNIDIGVDQFLANFEELGKIDLPKFMETHFQHNLSLDRFAYLTGRSLSTFNRDFRKAFNETPQKWLTRKRLEMAHFQIAEHSRKPKDVYLESGFEDFSHFSFAFKKQFGYLPTKLPGKS